MSRLQAQVSRSSSTAEGGAVLPAAEDVGIEGADDGQGLAPRVPMALPPSTTAPRHAAPKPPRLFDNPALLLGAAAAIMLAVAVAGYFVLPMVFGQAATATATPVPIVVSVPTNTAAPPSATPTPIVAAAGEKLLLVAPFVGYTSEELRYNVAGRIEEALQREIHDSKLAGVSVVVLPAPVTAQLQARSLLSATNASALIWGEYDAGRVRANVTVPGEGETDWVNPVESPSKLSVVINEDVPNAARMLALFSLGRAYRQEGDLTTALRAFEQALALKPQEATMLASLHFYIGTLLPKVRGLETGVLSAAIDHFTQALALKPEWAENVLYNRGTMYLGRGLLSPDERADLDAAIADLSTVVKRQPKGVLPLLNRGIAYYQRREEGDAAAAIADFARAITLAPDDYRGYYHRGLAQIRAGADGWSEDLLKAKSLNPQDPSIDNGLCWGYALDGKPQNALPYCEAAVAADPTGSSFDSRAIVYSDLRPNRRRRIRSQAVRAVGAVRASGSLCKVPRPRSRKLDHCVGRGRESVHVRSARCAALARNGSSRLGLTHAMPCRLWCVLHRHFDLVADSRHARRQAGRRALRPAVRRQPLPDLWPARETGCLHRTAPERGDVRQHYRGGAGLPYLAGRSHSARYSNSSRLTSAGA